MAKRNGKKHGGKLSSNGSGKRHNVSIAATPQVLELLDGLVAESPVPTSRSAVAYAALVLGIEALTAKFRHKPAPPWPTMEKA